MAPSKNFLKELSEKSRHFTVKVKIIEKARPQVSPNKTKCQRIQMKDDKGDEMQATIYGDDIPSYDDAIKYQKEYEISNAVVKPIKKEMHSRAEKYEMVV